MQAIFRFIGTLCIVCQPACRQASRCWLLAGAKRAWECRLDTALVGGPWAMLRAPGPGPAAYSAREPFAAGAPATCFGCASRALTIRDVAEVCNKCAARRQAAPVCVRGVGVCPPRACQMVSCSQFQYKGVWARVQMPACARQGRCPGSRRVRGRRVRGAAGARGARPPLRRAPSASAGWQLR